MGTPIRYTNSINSYPVHLYSDSYTHFTLDPFPTLTPSKPANVPKGGTENIQMGSTGAPEEPLPIQSRSNKPAHPQKGTNNLILLSLESIYI